jgi:hypothetical protein
MRDNLEWTLNGDLPGITKRETIFGGGEGGGEGEGRRWKRGRMRREGEEEESLLSEVLKLYDQHNAQVFNLFIYLFLPYIFQTFFKQIFRCR